MKNTKKPEHKVRKFIINNVDDHRSDIASFTATHFSITRQAVNLHLKNLVNRKILTESGETRNKEYILKPLRSWHFDYIISDELKEDIIWAKDVLPNMNDCSNSALDVLHHAFTEMFNNALDHAKGKNIYLKIVENAKFYQINIRDNGIGIFKKIKQKLRLSNENHAVFELTKGKLTTAPKQHSGEGIFFTSRMVNLFTIVSGKVGFTHSYGEKFDWFREIKNEIKGTYVSFKVNKNSRKNTRDLFLKYAPPDDHSFNKTVIPINLVEYDEISLVSRSQAKRVLKRIDDFKIVALDFNKIKYIGQGFADEIFRVFVNSHPQVDIVPINTCKKVREMIAHVEGR